MAPWRIAGATALLAMFALMGWQVQRLIDDQPWSDPLMWLTVAAGIASALCVLGWMWTTTENARRLIEPAQRAHLLNPNAAALTWIVPFVFVGVALGVMAVVGRRVGATGDRTIEAVPLVVVVVALFVAIPMTYRPMHHLARLVRQVGGYTVRVAQWMWVPVVMAVVGIASIVALRYAGVDDTTEGTATGWVPLWVVAVVAIGPCTVTVLLAWRAASSVEDAINVADARRRPGTSPHARRAPRPQAQRLALADRTNRIELVPGGELLRLVMGTLVAGLALLSVVGAVVTGMLWLESRDTGPFPADLQRLWDALDALRAASVGATVALLAAVFAWTFVTVLNVRRTSGRRRNPLIAASAWPAAAFAIWWIADRLIVDASTGEVVRGFGAQAVVLAVPFLILERSADALGARRTPLRIVYALTVVLLVHVQGLGGLSRLP
ncbi:MAG TPA: hypothetical protein VLN74_16575, partial [Ilumatobacteraceae bacterium]|nr:hypothetical protein [Ilumatobacteraceae bacterium]